MGRNAPGVAKTPLHIEIALHYSKSEDSADVAYAGRDSDATAQVHREFADAGLLDVARDSKRQDAPIH